MTTVRKQYSCKFSLQLEVRKALVTLLVVSVYFAVQIKVRLQGLLLSNCTETEELG